MRRKAASIILALTMILSLIPGTVFAGEGTGDEPTTFASTTVDSGTIGDDITWMLDEDGTLTISGAGRLDSRPWEDYMQSIKRVVIGEGVRHIGSRQFCYCTNLTEVTIPASIMSIEWEAFAGCTALTNVHFAGTEERWDTITIETGNDALKNATITYGNEIYTPHGTCGENLTWTLKEDGTLTISGTGEMTDYEYYSTPWNDYKSKIKKVVIFDGVTSIGNSALEGCTSLTDITIPSSVTSIGNSAIYGCERLTAITIPNGVKNIGRYAFCNCTGLTDITIPNSVISIGGGAFGSCRSLTDVVIPDSVTSIGGNPFSGCWNLTSVQVAQGNPAYIEEDGILFSKDKSQLILCLTNRTGSYSVPSSVTVIGDSAFYGCRALTNIVIPNGVTSIGAEAFYFTSLGSVVIPDSVTSIGGFAFGDCGGLDSVTIGKNVTTIVEWTFARCISLEKVVISSNLTTIKYCAFDECSALKDVYYRGTEDQWNAMDITGDGNYTLLNAAIHFVSAPVVDSVSVENGKLVKHYSDGTTEETALADGTISDFVTSETGEKTLTLASENACVAAYKNADGKYVALSAVTNEDGSYSYVVPEGVNEVTVAVKGDLDGDGQVSAKEARQILKASAEAGSLTGLQLLCADLDGDGVISAREARISLKASAGSAKIDW